LQEEIQTISEFIRRTDALAHRLGLNLSEIEGFLGISKAMLYAYRSGKNRITQKAWLKLASAERDALRAESEMGGNSESSANPNESGIGESAHLVREDSPIYRVRKLAAGETPAPRAESLDERVDKMERALSAIAEILHNLTKGT
jgi:hypothetical protein